MPWTSTVTRATGYGVTAAVWNSEHVDNLQFIREIGYAETTSDLSVTATTEATAQQLVSLGAITYEAVPTQITFGCAQARPDTGAAGRTLTFVLQDGASTIVVGVWGRQAAPAAAASNVPVSLSHRFIPSAASHTYNVRCFVSVATGLVSAGAGGSATNGPAWIRACRVPT